MTETTRLTRLRIAGFKSFAEPVTLDILPGLTGIVGPNGCGKSNVVEALRWAMGETSARSLRGGEMDDVIFAGTTARASRNLAEVTISLEGALPTPFEQEVELQVTRRIERGAGSHFRANGRELRARDVQTLYADLASGARSSGMVSQGRVAQLVNARPEERRQVLEEAAGITGLQARRHEAEMKLRQAEQNLQRAEDARAQLDAAREGLRRQARQAARYKNISSLIRNAEAEHLSILHARARDAVRLAEAALRDARASAEAARREVETCGEALADAEAALPAPREAEAQARSALERRRVEAESLAAESERLREAAASAASRLRELDADSEAARRAVADAGASVDRLAEEAARLAAERASQPAEIAACGQALAEARAREAAAQAAADDASARCTENAARVQQASEAAADAAARLAASRRALSLARADHATVLAAQVGADRLEAAADLVRTAEIRLETARSGFGDAEAARGAAERDALQARGAAERDAADRAAAARAVALAQARLAAQARACEAAKAEMDALSERLVPPDALDQAASDAALAEAALSGREVALAAAEQDAGEAAVLLADATRKADDRQAARQRAEARLEAVAARAASLAAEAARAETEWVQASAERPDAAVSREAEASLRAAADAVAGHEAALQRAAAGRARASATLAEARAALASAEAEHARLAGEAEGLGGALGSAELENGVLGALRVPDGLEAAFGVAFGPALDASLDEAAERFFRALPPLAVAANLPEGASCLGDHVDAPPALARLLSHAILLPDGMDGASLQASLPPGTTLITRQGAGWRWDGQVIRAGAPNAAASRLVHANRLVAVSASRDAAAAAVTAAAARCASAAQDETAALSAEDQARAGLAQAEGGLRAARDRQTGVAARMAKAEARLGSLAPMLDRLRAETLAADTALEEARAALAALAGEPDAADDLARAMRRDEAARQALGDARLARGVARQALEAARAALSGLKEASRDIDGRIAAQSLRAEQMEAERGAALSGLAAAEAVVAALPDPAALAAARLAAEAAEAEWRERERAARDERASAEQALESARAVRAALLAEAVRAENQLAAANAALDRCQAAQALAEAENAVALERLGALPDQAKLTEGLKVARAALDDARLAFGAARVRLADAEAAQRQAETSGTRTAQDLLAWRDRLGDAEARLRDLVRRRDAAREAVRQLGDAPAAIAARAENSARALAEAELWHRAASEALASADRRVRAVSLARRDAELDMAARREALLRAEAAMDAAGTALSAILARAAERLGEDAALPEPDAAGPEIEDRARRKYERLIRERDEMGPVNLRADLELAEHEQKLAAMEKEREELGSAIAKLRGSIGHLNREGRARLDAVFTQVDQHFRTLFTRMMGGGRAHLALTGNADPLLAGLEIYAEPPGKKLAALSLLSGGEQALTALSLIFAVFRCMPAPISVLDEVDAPLDDANVERFCTLLDDVVRDTGTRFLVVTHHQLTMSRMDRLFGVTMQERGVSRLLSVDLQRAAAMVQPELQAAE